MKRANSYAIAIFVDSRLASSIGRQSAEHFHDLASKAIQETLLELQGQFNEVIAPYGEVVEFDACHRSSRVYEDLIRKHQGVVLVSADSPQLSSGVLRAALTWMIETREFILGPSLDGGFYLFGGCKPGPADFLNPSGLMKRLDTRMYVHTIDDLWQLESELAELPVRLPSQGSLLAWIRALRSTRSK